MKKAQDLYLVLLVILGCLAFTIPRTRATHQTSDAHQEIAAIKSEGATAGCVPAPAGLVSWWPFDGNANDFQAINNAMPSGSPAFVPGMVAQAMNFDGTDDHARATQSQSLNIGTGNGFTIDLWINPTDVSVQRPLLEWNNNAGNHGVHLWIAVPIAGGGPGSLFANIKDTAGGDHFVSSAQGLLDADPNTYQHVALVFDKGNGNSAFGLYVNGQGVVAQNFFTFTPETSFGLYFGLRPGSGERFAGQMDEVEIFNRVLSPSEIQAIYNAGSAGKCKTRYVRNTDVSGPGSLPQAVADSNTYNALNTIAFHIPGSGVHSINAALVIRGPVTIDGTTQPGYAGAPLIELDGTGSDGASGLLCFAPATIKGLVINRFDTGISLTEGSDGSRIIGNYIGTDATGNIARGNRQGIGLITSNNIIGGTTPAERNIISGNHTGIILNGATQTRIQGNYIGTNATGNTPVSNFGWGIHLIFSFSSNNIIGGTTSGAGNVISGNGVDGIAIDGSGNVIQGNYIGTDVTGTQAIGNSGSGIGIAGSNNTVGGTVAGARNIIAFNSDTGVKVYGSAAVGNAIRGNSIFSNGSIFTAGLGIDLTPSDGVTPNDPGDGDTGPNNLQNFPVLTSAISPGSDTIIQGTLNSVADQSFRIELFANSACDGSGYGEGQTFIGLTFANTVGSSASFSLAVPTASITGPYITATETNVATGDTSELSQCFSTCIPMLTPTSASFPGNVGSGTASLTGSVMVTMPSGCNWTAVSNDSFITITGGSGGSGNGTVTYSLDPNPSNTTRRIGTIAIADKTFTVLQGPQFLDVPTDHIFYTFIGKLAARGVTVGCGGGNYCPESSVTREQMAAFIIRARGEFSPPTPASQRPSIKYLLQLHRSNGGFAVNTGMQPESTALLPEQFGDARADGGVHHSWNWGVQSADAGTAAVRRRGSVKSVL